MSEKRVHIRHLRALGYCLVPGVRLWCEQNNVDFRRLVKEGIPVSEIAARKDALGAKAVEQAMKDER